MFDTWPLAWRECASSFLQSIYDISGSAASREIYRSTLSRFFTLCNTRPDQVTRTAVLTFMQSPSTSKRNYMGPASASTVCQRLCVLRSFYRFASEWEVKGAPLFQKVNPTQGLKYVDRAVNPRSLDAEELNRFFAVIPTDTLKGVRDRTLFFL